MSILLAPYRRVASALVSTGSRMLTRDNERCWRESRVLIHRLWWAAIRSEQNAASVDTGFLIALEDTLWSDGFRQISWILAGRYYLQPSRKRYSRVNSPEP